MGPATRYNLNKILIYGVLWALAGLLFTLVEKGVIGEMTTYPSTGVAYDFNNSIVVIPLVSFLGGILLILIDILVINKRVIGLSFPAKLAIKSLVFLLIIFGTTILAGAIANTFTLDAGFFSAEVWSSLSRFMSDFAFWSILIYAGFMTVLFLFIVEVSNSLGMRVFKNFFSGKYHRPKKEEKIFMFLDLKDSTGIAERLGNLSYYEFLNQFFKGISPAILNSWGTIYQYVGDEVVIHWPKNRSVESIECFFKMQAAITEKQSDFMTRYGVVPAFRAGIHTGEVSIGEIGTLKKEILYIGDVLNATSRIQGLCKELGVDLLVSEDVVKLMSGKSPNGHLFVDKGSSELRGKQERVRVFGVKREE